MRDLSIILEITYFIFRHCVTSEKSLFVQSVPLSFTFMIVFEKAISKLIFRRSDFEENFKKCVFFLLPVGKSGFRVLCVSLQVFSGTEKLMKFINNGVSLKNFTRN